MKHNAAKRHVYLVTYNLNQLKTCPQSGLKIDVMHNTLECIFADKTDRLTSRTGAYKMQHFDFGIASKID